MAGDRRCTVLSRLVDRLYFGAHLDRVHLRSARPYHHLSRQERLRRENGPSQKLVAMAFGAWLLALLALARLFALMMSCA
jgi:hypothetical protein